MHSQVQVPIPIHGECAVIINFFHHVSNSARDGRGVVLWLGVVLVHCSITVAHYTAIGI